MTILSTINQFKIPIIIISAILALSFIYYKHIQAIRETEQLKIQMQIQQQNIQALENQINAQNSAQTIFNNNLNHINKSNNNKQQIIQQHKNQININEYNKQLNNTLNEINNTIENIK